MLLTPTKGFARSIREHNGCRDIFCDWIEASVLFYDEQLSVSDIVDSLIERQWYDSQDFAREWVQDGWRELQRRRKWIGESCGYTLDTNWIKRSIEWRNKPAHAFCVLLSLAPFYDWWADRFGRDYTEQGYLFECLTGEAIQAQFPGWKVYQTGWSRTNTVQLLKVIEEVASRLGEVKGRVDLWDDYRAKEMGLDILWYRPFLDERPGISVYMMQCASGANWKPKLKTPDIEAWRSMVQFTTMPKRAFASPFSFLDKEFSQNCISLDGVFIDRNRLLCACYHSADWLSQLLAQRIITWSQPRVDELLLRSQ